MGAGVNGLGCVPPAARTDWDEDTAGAPSFPVKMHKSTGNESWAYFSVKMRTEKVLPYLFALHDAPDQESYFVSLCGTTWAGADTQIASLHAVSAHATRRRAAPVRSGFILCTHTSNDDIF